MPGAPSLRREVPVRRRPRDRSDDVDALGPFILVISGVLIWLAGVGLFG